MGAKEETYILMKKLKEAGCGIIIPSELPEAIRMNERIIVMSGERISKTLSGTSINEENVLRLEMENKIKSFSAIKEAL